MGELNKRFSLFKLERFSTDDDEEEQRETEIEVKPTKKKNSLNFFTTSSQQVKVLYISPHCITVLCFFPEGTMVKAVKKSKTPKLVKQQQEDEENGNVKEGYNLLGSPTFEELENGRFKCLETGHETLPKDKELYSNSKRCRLGLIDAALSQKKPPLNMFKQDPHCKLKVVCKLTGDIVNKTEEHIWKHINGKRFLNKLEQKEAEKLTSKEIAVEKVEEKSLKNSKLNANGEKKDRKKKDKIMKVKSNEVDKDAMRDLQTSDSEEPGFWFPPVGSRWDFDDGKDRWGSDAESGPEPDNDNMKEGADTENDVQSGELTTQTKRMSIEIGPSSFASRKKKQKTKSAADHSIA